MGPGVLQQLLAITDKNKTSIFIGNIAQVVEINQESCHHCLVHDLLRNISEVTIGDRMLDWRDVRLVLGLFLLSVDGSNC